MKNSNLPSRLRGPRGMAALLREARAALSPENNVSLCHDIDLVLATSIEEIPEVLFDGYRVWQSMPAMGDDGRLRPGHVVVSDVLDVIVKLIKEDLRK